MLHNKIVVKLPESAQQIEVHVRLGDGTRLWILVDGDDKLPITSGRNVADESKPRPVRGRGIDPRIFGED